MLPIVPNRKENNKPHTKEEIYSLREKPGRNFYIQNKPFLKQLQNKRNGYQEMRSEQKISFIIVKYFYAYKHISYLVISMFLCFFKCPKYTKSI